jgi:hypothetical protein
MKTKSVKVPKSVNAALYDLSKGYHDGIPLGAMFDVCRKAGLEPVCEDGTPWSGFLCGREGRAVIELKDCRKALTICWYKMPSGRYEVTPYVA